MPRRLVKFADPERKQAELGSPGPRILRKSAAKGWHLKDKSVYCSPKSLP
jgi:hypothetical protein